VVFGEFHLVLSLKKSQMRRIALFTVLAVLLLAGCKDKPQAPAKKPATAVVEEKKPDSTFVEEVIEEAPVVEQQPMVPNKYFLISGSFQELSNAEKFQRNLANQGIDAEIIQREPGPNSDFYKVSYRGFSDWNEALRALENERNTPGKEGVWLLVKN
jgi:cell division protein FtsN